MILKKIYTSEEVLAGGTSYNQNYNNPNYKQFILNSKELYITIELDDKNDLNGYCGSVLNSNFYQFDKIYFAVDMLKSENRIKSSWQECYW